MQFLAILALVVNMFTETVTTEKILLDGKITENEWTGAAEHGMKNGGSVLLKHEGDVLYVALISTQKIWAHVYLAEGSTIKVMHASAALDDISYKKEKSVWRTSDSFKFELRDTAYTSELIAARESFYRVHGWVSNTVNMGTGKVLEFKISLKSVSRPAHLACVISNYNSEFSWFPVSVNDDALLTRLVQGYATDSLNFKPNKWRTIK